ncbi:hypothetical protein QQX98_009234 [Neonectria punicea]|uniref:Uncharacterized protein n=1 Tax=Neonectria punicea TaxID=979145 RepID=A0ABR1GSU9_9HYPO
MACLLALAVWTSWLARVYASQPNIGWGVGVTPSNVYISYDYYADDGSLSVEFPLDISRISATANSFALTISTSPYIFNSTATSSAPAVVYTGNIDVAVSDNSTFTQDIKFNMKEPEQDLLISFGIDDGTDGATFVTVDSNGFVIARDVEQQGSWAAREIAVYDHEVNLAITEEFNNLAPDVVDDLDPRDLGRDPVVHRENELKPEDKSGSTGSSTTTTPGGYTSSSTTSSQPSSSTKAAGGESVPPDDHTYVSTSLPGDDPGQPGGYTYTGTVGDEVTTTVPGGCGRGGAHTIIITRYRTVSVCPTPSACTSDDKHHKARQATERPAFISAHVTFADRNLIHQHVRFLNCYISAEIYRGTEKVATRVSPAVTDANGQAVFRFAIADGERVVAKTIWVFLTTEWFHIGTRATFSDTLAPKLVRLDVNTASWSVNAGDTIQAEAFYDYSVYNLGLAVADTYTTLTEFLRTQVATGDKEMERVNIWFPGESSPTVGAYFSPSSNPYINLPQIHAANPSVMAHEYGHYVHWIGRKKAPLYGGGRHSFCGDGPEKSLATSFEEGYATAFGMFALDGTPLIDPWSVYMSYTNRQERPERGWLQNIENFNCFEKYMLRQEGRIAAALFDMVDWRLDEFPTSSNEVGRISDGFKAENLAWRWNPRFIFWLLIQDNPESIEQYWRKFQSYPGQKLEWENLAWAIFDYNYADFSQQVSR